MRVGGGAKQARRVGRLVPLSVAASAFVAYQIVQVEQLGDADLGVFEGAALHLHDHIEDAVGVAAGTSGLRLLRVPSPRGIAVGVIPVRAADVRSAARVIVNER